MVTIRKITTTLCLLMLATYYSCVPTQEVREAAKTMPESYNNTVADTLNSAKIQWNEFFSDEKLRHLIQEALTNNQELHIVLQQIAMAKNEIQARKGEYLPFVNFQAGADLEKVGKHTRNGSVEEQLTIDEDKFPDPLSNYSVGITASWELDVWKKLRNSKKVAVMEYLAL